MIVIVAQGLQGRHRVLLGRRLERERRRGRRDQVLELLGRLRKYVLVRGENGRGKLTISGTAAEIAFNVPKQTQGREHKRRTGTTLLSLSVSLCIVIKLKK